MPHPHHLHNQLVTQLGDVLVVGDAGREPLVLERERLHGAGLQLGHGYSLLGGGVRRHGDAARRRWWKCRHRTYRDDRCAQEPDAQEDLVASGVRAQEEL